MTEIESELPGEERQDSDYDGAWKETIRLHLAEAIQKGFPTFADLIDWNCEPQWLDKEISQIIGRFGHRNREVDLLFKVRLLDGRDQWILCHLEIQTRFEAEFPFRIDLYNAGLKWMFQQEVVTLVILADLRPDWRPSTHRFELGDFRSVREFPICKLLDRLAADWVDDDSLFVQVARAQIAALRTSSDPDARFGAKTQLVRNLYTMGYTSDRIREIFRLIDWMMRLRPDLDRRFKSELVDFEEENRMPYVTSIERLAKEEGLEEGLEKGIEKGIEKGRAEGLEKGREQGSATLLLRILTRQCGHLPEDIQQQIHQLKLEQSQNLGEALLDFKSIDDLKIWLKTTIH